MKKMVRRRPVGARRFIVEDDRIVVPVLADRVSAALAPERLESKHMFGGIVFMSRGNMLCCVSPKGLMLRVGAEAEPRALAMSHARPCRETGRRMPGFIVVDAKGIETDRALADWLAMARNYVDRLPAKPSTEQSPRGKSARTPAKKR